MNSLFIIFLVALFVAPIPFGLVTPLGQGAMAVAIWGMVAAQSVLRARTGEAAQGTRLRWELLVFCLLILWIVVQMLPVGGNLAHPLWGELPAWLPGRGNGSITLSPSLTFEALMRLTAYAGLFWITYVFCQDRERARITQWTLVGAGVLFAVYGIANYVFGNDNVLGLQRYAYYTDLTGTFVNRNSAGALLGLCLLPVLAMLVSSFSKASSQRKLSWTERVSNIEAGLQRVFLALSLAVVLGAALVMTHSRGSVLSVGTAALSICLLVLLTQGKSGLGTQIFIGVLALATPLVLMLGGEGMFSRLDRDGLESEGRLSAYQAIWDAIRDSPLLGFGFGSFERAFSIYAPAELDVWFTRGHNDWLEGVFGLGWIGAILLNGILISLVIRCLIGALRRRRDRIYSIVAVGAAVQLGAHSLVDFSLQVPAVAIYFTVILATGFAQSVGSPAPERAPASAVRARRRSQEEASQGGDYYPV